jgi:hypothetical protein
MSQRFCPVSARTLLGVYSCRFCVAIALLGSPSRQPQLPVRMLPYLGTMLVHHSFMCSRFLLFRSLAVALAVALPVETVSRHVVLIRYLTSAEQISIA